MLVLSQMKSKRSVAEISPLSPSSLTACTHHTNHLTSRFKIVGSRLVPFDLHRGLLHCCAMADECDQGRGAFVHRADNRAGGLKQSMWPLAFHLHPRLSPFGWLAGWLSCCCAAAQLGGWVAGWLLAWLPAGWLPGCTGSWNQTLNLIP